MSTSYDNFKNEMNKKEENIQNEILFYKEHMEQILRIELLQHELSELKEKMNDEKFKRINLCREKRAKDQYKNNFDEFINLCRINCKEAFEKIKNYEAQVNGNYPRNRLPPLNSTELVFQTPFHSESVLYTYNQIDINTYLVYCSCRCKKPVVISYGQSTNSPPSNVLIGKYNSTTCELTPSD
jgi:hypothetical protein